MQLPSLSFVQNMAQKETTGLLVNDETISPVIQLSKRRWLVLGLFMLYGFSNQLQYVAYVTIVDQAKAFFSCTPAAINALAAIFPAIYVIFVFPGCKAYGSLGLRKGMLIGATLNGLGSIIKMVAAAAVPNFWLLVVANVFNAGAQVLFLGLPPMVASIWFPDDERTLATALGTLTGFVGMACGLFYSPRVLNGFPHSEKTGMTVLFATQAVASVLPMIGVFFFVSNAPPSPPSRTANSGAQSIPSILAVLKRYCTNKNFMVMAITFGAVVGLFTALATVLPQLLKPLGIGEDKTGVLSFVGILSGALSCALTAPVIDKYRQYKKPWLLLLSLQCIFLAIMMVVVYAMDAPSVAASFVLIIALEMAMLPQFPVAMELAVELTYPDSESLAGSALMVSLSFWSVIGTIVFSIILGKNPTIGDTRLLLDVMMGVLVAVWLALVLFLKEDLRRLRHEKDGHEETTS